MITQPIARLMFSYYITSFVTAISIFLMLFLLYKYDNFEQLYSNHNKISIGYKTEEIADPEDMLMYYTKEEIEKYGVLGIKVMII